MSNEYKFYRLTQNSSINETEQVPNGYLHIDLSDIYEWDLDAGYYIQGWDNNASAYYEEEESNISDFPFTSNLLHVYSPRLYDLMKDLQVEGIQYLPIRIIHRFTNKPIEGYQIANYLSVLDCLDRKHSEYELYSTESLMFWEKRPFMLGTFRSITRSILDLSKIRKERIFRLWGWPMVIVREEIKVAIDNAGITGCLFTALETTNHP